QPVDPIGESSPVVEGMADLVSRVSGPGSDGYPVEAVIREQVEPVVEPALIDVAPLVVQIGLGPGLGGRFWCGPVLPEHVDEPGEPLIPGVVDVVGPP